MKQTFRFIPIILATAALLASCAKEPVFEKNGALPQEEGSRVIAVSFAPQTKTALGDDGLTPEFTGKDEWVKVSNSSMSENCKVVVSPSGRASITTSLNGALKAVYPAYTAKMDGSRISGIDIPSYQDGTFASANICMAEMEDEKEEGLTFHNKTALFAIIPPEGTAQLKVTSLRPVGNDGTRSGYALPISTGQEFDAITITATGKDSDGKVYLSLCPGVNLSDLSFEAEFSTPGTGSIKGIPMKAIEEAEAENTTVGGTIYTINGNNWHEYVTIKGVKWATMNVGAAQPSDAGLYFAWGDVEGQVAEGSAFSKGFLWTNCPFTNGGDFNAATSKNIFTKYVSEGKEVYSSVGTADGKITLDFADDAANANWGGAWRMPTRDEYNGLKSLLIQGSYNSGWNYGYGEDNNTVFLPNAGYGYNTGLNNMGSYAHYWSSSLNRSNPSGAYCLYAGPAGGDGYAPGGVTIASHNRYCGQSVRAIVNDGDSRMKKVIWENDGSHESVSWNGVYRFSSEERPTGEEIYAIPMDEWDDVIKGGTFYLLARIDSWAQVRITTGWWSTTWTGNDIFLGDSHYTDNGDGTFLVEINFAGDPILDVLDEQHLLFTGGGYTPLELYYYAAPLKPAPRELVLWKGEAYADDFTNQPSFLDNYGQDLLKAGAKAGQEVRFYITPIDGQWKFEIVEGHWGWVMPWSELTADERNEKMIYRSYCSPGHEDTEGKYVEWDLNAHGGYVPLTLTQEMLTVMLYPNQDVDWGGTFIGNGDNVIVTKITLLPEGK